MSHDAVAFLVSTKQICRAFFTRVDMLFDMGSQINKEPAASIAGKPIQMVSMIGFQPHARV